MSNATVPPFPKSPASLLTAIPLIPSLPEAVTVLAPPPPPRQTVGHSCCSAPPVTEALNRGLPNASAADYSTAGEEAVKTGCWLNVADVDDFMVAQPWLKGMEQAHVVTNPNSLRLAALSVG